MGSFRWSLALLLVPAVAGAQGAAGDASVRWQPRTEGKTAEGTHIVEDAVLTTSLASYTLRYDAVERADDPSRVGFTLWAPTIGYIPLGLPSPSQACWYWQAFMQWTFDDLNLQSYRVRTRVVREYGQDAMVEYVWDTPKVTAVARFAMTSGSDKLLLFGRYEPKTEVKQVRLRLMAYPATFSQPWQRSVTTAKRTLTTGEGVPLDLVAERWLLLEDTLPGRTADGSAGLLLGDSAAFEQVALDGIGGYSELVNLTLKPGRREFALGLYEFPSLPDPEETRAYFRRSADAESDALAKLAAADLDQPLPPLPVDRERSARLLARDREVMQRPAERWQPDAKPLGFPWAARLPGGPVKVAVLAARFSAYETMELARRLQLDTTHLYFDGKGTLANPDYWPYAGTTGLGSLGAGMAMREAVRICAAPDRDAILVADVDGGAIPGQVREVVLKQVQSGKGLVLAGGPAVLNGWPKELTASRDDSLVAPALSCLPWQAIPGLRDGERGRVGAEPPFRGYRYGQGRVVVFTARVGEYSCLVPLNDASEGVDGATDRILALQAAALLAAAGRPLPAQISIAAPEQPVPAATPYAQPLRIAGAPGTDLLVRVQDDLDQTLLLETQRVDPKHPRLALPGLPAMRTHFVDVMLRDQGGNCLGFAGTRLEVRPETTIKSVSLSPARQVHPEAPPMVELPTGGRLACEVSVEPASGSVPLSVACEVRDCLDRLLARGAAKVDAKGQTRITLALPRPVTVCHQVDTVLVAEGRRLAMRRDRFTIPLPYPYDDFTYLMWSYAAGEPVIRRENRLCYELGSDMMDLCHMRGYTDKGAAREYALAARSGQRLVPYVSRIAFDSVAGNRLNPSPFDPKFIEGERASMEVCCRQAAPYRPAAYTLGDENYLSDARFEADASPEAMVEFRKWLQQRYGTIEALNAAWKTALKTFDGVQAPMWLEEAAKQREGFAPWFDHRGFMDTVFAGTHERFAGFVRQEDPGAKVGWDGFLGYHWQAGYDFHKLTRNLDLNQVYTASCPQGEMVASLKRPGALSGEWGNSIADREDGFTAIAWHNLFKGHNSCWWWTSWGCDYIPFNPDLSLSSYGKWYFAAADEIRSGPGKLLVRAKRDDAGIAILYAQADMFAATLAGQVAKGAIFAGDGAWLDDHRSLLRGLEDAGCGYRHVAAAEIEADPQRLTGYKVLFLPFATCMSDRLAEAIRSFVTAGGTVIADGRVGLLTGNGVLRAARPLDAVFGVQSAGGLEAFATASRAGKVDLGGQSVPTDILEPTLKPAAGTAAQTVDGTPVIVCNTSGKGRGVLLNFPFRLIGALRGEKKEAPVLALLTQLLGKAGVKPYAQLRAPAGPVRCVKQSLFREGDLRYLALEQDILQPGLPGQTAQLTLDQPAFVYDVRSGKPVGQGRTASWEVAISRGAPRLYALLPYRVSGLRADAPATCRLGETLNLGVAVDAAAPGPQFHVVHVSVFAPGSPRPHRQYSQSVECPRGRGQASIPFALNDPEGAWRLTIRDVASGVKVEKTVTVRK